MRFIKLSLVLLLSHGFFAAGNEHGGGAPAPEGEGEGGEGKASKPPRDQREYTEKSLKMNALAAKIEEAEARFKTLVHEKEEASGAEAKAPILKEMAEVAKQREKDDREFQKLKSEVQQRYPNEGNHVNRHAVEKAEHGESPNHAAAAAPSLDDLIRETKILMDRKYAGPRAETHDARRPASEREVLRPHPRLRLEK